MKKVFILTIVVLFLMSASSYAFSSSDGFIVKFGLMEKYGNDFQVYKETTEIPFITKNKNPDFFWGLTVSADDDINHSKYYIIYLPQPIKEIGEGLLKEGHTGLQIHKSKPYKFRNDHWTYTWFRFHESDPIGDWKIEIFVDDALIRTIRFNVSTLYK